MEVKMDVKITTSMQFSDINMPAGYFSQSSFICELLGFRLWRWVDAF